MHVCPTAPEKGVGCVVGNSQKEAAV